MRSTFWAVTLCCAVFGVSEAPAAIVNGDFETGDLTGWAVQYQTGSGGAGVLFDANVGSDVAQILAVEPTLPSNPDNGAFLTQSFTVGYGGELLLDYFADVQRTDPGQTGFLLWSIRVLDSNSQTMSSADSEFSSSGWEALALAFPSAGTYTIEFGAVVPASGGLFQGVDFRVDNVRLVIVPEPATWALGLIGLAAIAAAGKRG